MFPKHELQRFVPDAKREADWFPTSSRVSREAFAKTFLERARPAMLFVIDFDGTVAPEDTVDALLEQFADPAWRSVEEQWVCGAINSRQCMAAQMALVTAERGILETFLQSVEIDPSFQAFISRVREFAEVAVVSDGLDYPIRHALRHFDPAIPIYANHIEFREAGLDLTFPYSESSCAVGSGVCKCSIARGVCAGRASRTILIGDGRSDYCIARTADFVFAKGSLRRFCEAENIAHTPFETFRDVLTVVNAWNVPEREEQPSKCLMTLTP